MPGFVQVSRTPRCRALHGSDQEAPEAAVAAVQEVWPLPWKEASVEAVNTGRLRDPIPLRMVLARCAGVRGFRLRRSQG
jgi:hypothetical protein